MNRDPFYGSGNNAEALEEMAADREQRSRESFERCDTDGFLSQWANDIGAQMLRAQAAIARNGGLAAFVGLYDGDRRVAAKLVSMPCYNAPWASELKWKLRDDEADRYGRRFIPLAPSGSMKDGKFVRKVSRVQKSIGLVERMEYAPAVARICGSGKGLSGAASAYVSNVRNGCEWGSDAQVEEASE